ncbi:MAG TPA: HAD family hydrolase [Solirubrobacteraceae bacterium]|jgi:HAD superfamily hydrolase (TIGR01490 family)|nr:HAD family hydrolase [Solirubrobacteraceae bacterium]
MSQIQPDSRAAAPGSPPGELASPGEARAAAFFDLDKTLMQGSSAFQFGRAAYRAGLLGRRQLLADAVANVQFRLRGATDADSLALRERIAASLEGTRVVDLERLGADVLALILPRIYPQMLALAHEHQDAGRRAYIVTAASQELADILAQVMALDGGIGSQISEVRDGVFTGRPTGVFVYRTGKAQALQDLAAREGIDLGASFAYSDSESDLPMLEAVGHPVAVNPDGALLRIAREREWDVLRFDRLGRRLKTAAALGAAAGAGGIGSVVIARRLRSSPPVVAVRRLRRARRGGLSSALQR